MAIFRNGGVAAMERELHNAQQKLEALQAKHSASISVESTGPDKPAVVVVQGSFEGKDGEQFFTKTGSLAAALVRLESNGGSLVAGIQIGETTPHHSISSSARASSDGGTVRPSALAVPRLMTSSNVVGCLNGRSEGFAPLIILST